jgi:N-acetylmuramoyl-L-alanine amidase
MSPWAKRMLVGSMAVWTLLTLAAGWYAMQGTSAGASDERATFGALASPTAAGRADSTPTADAESDDVSSSHSSATATVTEGTEPDDTEADATATPRPGYRPQPPPKYPAAAGIGDGADSLDIEGEPARSPRPASTARAVIVLDPGHGRGDPGAVHYWDDGTYYTEAESNQTNAELIRDRLIGMGYEVYLTRTGAGTGPGAPLPLQFITSDLFARVQLARSVDADLYLAIHGNGASVKSISGPETWYCGKHEEGEANAVLARRTQQAMMDALHEYGYAPPDRGIKEDAASHHSGDFCQFVVTRESPVPAALLEFLFLSNRDDAQVLNDPRSHELLADHVARALDEFMTERGY